MTFTWLKGHGTENDFVLLPDHDGTVHGDLAPAFVAALCDRRRGIGADGVLRVIRSAAAGLEAGPEAPEWFMDYRNSDGSVSEMCGNGIRVFARHLVDEGLVDGTQPVPILTRDGVKTVTVAGDEVTVDMGPYTVGGASEVSVDPLSWKATEVHTGNPHAVAFVESLDDAGTLLQEPHYDAAVYPQGVNIEFVQREAPHHVAMRVHERGSGETRSCGTGACAVAIATARSDAAELPVEYRVDVPGGTLHITVDDERVVMRGPAEIVARGEMEWLA